VSTSQKIDAGDPAGFPWWAVVFLGVESATVLLLFGPPIRGRRSAKKSRAESTP
jgi:hypothetical protein